MKAWKLFVTAWLLVVFFAASPAGGAPAEPSVLVTVEKGDCLIRICRKYLEDSTQWRKIASLNEMKNPDLVLPGQEIRFPARMMKGTPVSGVVTLLEGSAEVKPPQSESWVALGRGDKIGEGSLVRTGERGTVEIRFEDGNTFLLGPGTEIGLNNARQSGDNYSRYKMSLKVGKMISNIRETPDSRTAVEIEAPTAVLGVRGTVFRSYVAPDGTTRVEVIEGTVAVEGGNEEVEVKQGEGTVVYRDRAPLAPRSLLPPPALAGLPDAFRSLPARIAFTAVEGAASFRVVMASDADFRNIVREEIIGAREVFEIAEMADGAAFLRTSSIDADGLEGLASGAFEIRVRLNPIAPFVEIPDDRAEYKARALGCRWLRVADAARYHVQVAETPDFRQPVRDRDDLAGNEYPTGDLDYKTYYFRVRSIAADDFRSDWSDTLAFTFLPPPASPPVDAPEMDRREIRLRWHDLGPDVTYRFQLSRDGEFGEILLERTPAQPQVAFVKPEEPGTYHVRVSGIDSAGREGAFSRPQTFVVTPPPAPPRLEPPAVEEKEVRVAWENLGPEVTYRFQVSRDAAFGEILVDRALDVPGTAFAKPAEAGTYFVRARGIDADGRAGAFSEPRDFVIVKRGRGALFTMITIWGLFFLFGL